MKVTAEKNEKVANMIFSTIYPLYLSRLEKNGRTKEELNQVIEWLTGFNENELQALIENKVTFRTFFKKFSSNVFQPNQKIQVCIIVYNLIILFLLSILNIIYVILIITNIVDKVFVCLNLKNENLFH